MLVSTALPRDPLPDADALFHMSEQAYDRGQHDEAVDCWRKALDLDPHHIPSLTALCRHLLDRGDVASAIPLLRRAVSLAPTHPDTVSLIAGIAAADLQDFPLAQSLLTAGLRRDPDNALLRWQVAEVMVQSGDWTALPTWSTCREWGHVRSGAVSAHEVFGVPRWEGEPLNGTILIVATSGYGEILQALRYVRLVQQRAGRVVLGLPHHPDLKPLLAYQRWLEAELWTGESPLPGTIAAACLIETLPGIFRTLPHTIPPCQKVTAPASQVRRWRRKLRPYAGIRKIGICWQASDTPSGWHRSVPVELLKPLAELPDTVCISLQKNVTPPAGLDIIVFPDTFSDWAMTAGLVAHCDEVVTVDTSIAHLAGSMRKPTLLLVPWAGDWRWEHGHTTPWYPSMRVFRQPRPGDWSAVVARVADELRRFSQQLT